MDNFDSSSQYNSRFAVGLYSSEVRVWLADDGAHVLHDYFPPQGEWVHYSVTRETGNSFSLYKKMWFTKNSLVTLTKVIGDDEIADIL